MVGDALSDWEAARACGALFYPISPSLEDESWQRFFEEALPRYFAREYAGDYMTAQLDRFVRLLPEEPPWKAELGRASRGFGKVGPSNWLSPGVTIGSPSGRTGSQLDP